MGFSTGRSAAKAAKRKAKQLEYIQKLNDRTAILREMRLAAGGIGSQTAASGVGLESSGGQGVRSSVIAQGSANYILAREAGKLQKSMEKDIRRAKRRAGAVSLVTTTVGAVIGGIFGGPAGVKAGADAGQQVGGLVTGSAMRNVAQAEGSNAQSGFNQLSELVKSGAQTTAAIVDKQSQAEDDDAPQIIDESKNLNTGAFGAFHSSF